MPTIIPPTALVITGEVQQFSISPFIPAVLWSVNGIPGGNEEVGTITAFGTYRAPIVPPTAPLTIHGSSTSSGVSVSASVQVMNPLPQIGSVDPKIAVAGTSPVKLTVAGTGFRPQSRIRIDGTEVTTTYTSISEIYAVVDPRLLQDRLSVEVTAENSGPGGGITSVVKIPVLSPATALVNVGKQLQFRVADLPGGTVWIVNGEKGGTDSAGRISDGGVYTAPPVPPSAAVTVTATSAAVPALSVSATVSVVNPVPSVHSIAPMLVASGTGQVKATIKGANFAQQSVAKIGQNAIETTFVSSSELTAVIPDSMVAGSESVPIKVVTPEPGGGAAAILSIYLLWPGSAELDVGTQQKFSVSGFPGETVWFVDGQKGGSEDRGTITQDGLYSAPSVAPSAAVTITVASAADESVTASATTRALYPQPTLNEVLPKVAIAGVPFLITAKGRNFIPQSSIVVNQNPVPTTFVSESELTALVPGSMIGNVDSVSVAIATPEPGGGTTFSATIPLVGVTVVGTTHPLVAEYEFDVPTDGAVSVEFGPNTNYGRTTWSVSVPSGGGKVSVLVAGMKADSVYHLRARVDLADGTVLLDNDRTFTTGSLPSGLRFPTVTMDAPFTGGIELTNAFGIGGQIANAIDNDGSIIWYYAGPSVGANVFPIRQLSNGHFLVNYNAIREVDLTGAAVRIATVEQVKDAIAGLGVPLVFTGLHHDVIQLPNGHWILLFQEQRQFTDLPGIPGVTKVASDGLLELDESNKAVWIWRAFDHLDINRHPYGISDWTHANAVAYTPDGNLLLSMRHQNWIIKIDYADGTGDGSVLWRLGAGGDFFMTGGDPAQWFYGQHFPNRLTSDPWRYQLAVFDNGNQRPMPDGARCDLVAQCYTRAIILDVDEISRSAAVAWEYRPGWYASWGGSIVALPNGNIEFDSSTVNGGPSRVVEVTREPGSHAAWTMYANQNFYRSFRIPSLYPGIQW